MNKNQYKIFLKNFSKDKKNIELKSIEVNKILRFQVMCSLVLIMTICSLTSILNEGTTAIWGAVISNLIIFSAVLYTYKENEKKRQIIRSTRKGLYFSNRIRYILKKEHKLFIMNTTSMLQDFHQYIFDKFSIQENFEYFVKNNENVDLQKKALQHITQDKNKLTHSDIIFLEKENHEDLVIFVKSLQEIKQVKLQESIKEF